jgi:hypothetical protein
MSFAHLPHHTIHPWCGEAARRPNEGEKTLRVRYSPI